MKKKVKKGFTLVEVLVAFIILAVSYTVLIYLHSNAMKTYYHAENLFKIVLKLDNYLTGEVVEGVEVSREKMKVRGLTIVQETFKTSSGKVSAYFVRWKVE
jgi:prepilin-type N-terminal cleavage/methylation domain-containing protein